MAYDLVLDWILFIIADKCIQFINSIYIQTVRECILKVIMEMKHGY